MIPIPSRPSVLILGLGGGTAARALRRLRPEASGGVGSGELSKLWGIYTVDYPRV